MRPLTEPGSHAVLPRRRRDSGIIAVVMSSGRLLVASLLLALAMGCLGLAVHSASSVIAGADRPRGTVDVPASSYVALVVALVLLVAGVVVLVSAVRRRQ